MAFPASQLYQAWAQRLRLPWMSTKGRGYMMALAKVLGDLTIDWGTQANLEHLPEYASSPSVALTASERQIDAGPTEASSALATRITGAVQSWQRAGTPLGLLTALHWAGFRGAIIVQQNGRAFQLADPNVLAPRQTITVLGGHPGIGNAPWWTFDNDRANCSRFALLFPAGTTSFARIGFADFTGAEDGETVPWPTAVFASPFDDTSYLTLPGPPATSGGAVAVWCINDSTKTSNSIRVGASGSFVGRVAVLAWAVGAHPFAGMSATDLARLRRIVRGWKPAKARCMGAFAIISGELWGWPVGTWGDPGVWGGEAVAFVMET